MDDSEEWQGRSDGCIWEEREQNTTAFRFLTLGSAELCSITKLEIQRENSFWGKPT